MCPAKDTVRHWQSGVHSKHMHGFLGGEGRGRRQRTCRGTIWARARGARAPGRARWQIALRALRSLLLWRCW